MKTKRSGSRNCHPIAGCANYDIRKGDPNAAHIVTLYRQRSEWEASLLTGIGDGAKRGRPRKSCMEVVKRDAD